MTLQDIELTSLDAIVDLTVKIQAVRTYINNTATTIDQNKLSGFVSVGFLLVLRFWTFLYLSLARQITTSVVTGVFVLYRGESRISRKGLQPQEGFANLFLSQNVLKIS